jgi:hypothetical protein
VVALPTHLAGFTTALSVALATHFPVFDPALPTHLAGFTNALSTAFSVQSDPSSAACPDDKPVEPFVSKRDNSIGGDVDRAIGKIKESDALKWTKGAWEWNKKQGVKNVAWVEKAALDTRDWVGHAAEDGSDWTGLISIYREPALESLDSLGYQLRQIFRQPSL